MCRWRLQQKNIPHKEVMSHPISQEVLVALLVIDMHKVTNKAILILQGNTYMPICLKANHCC